MAHLWAIILAAGDGKRLQAFRFGHEDVSVPKQYRRFAGHKSMLQWTVARAEALVPRARVVTIVADQHRRWWRDQLANLPMQNVVVQPSNKGTAVGVLLPLLWVLEQDPDAVVLVLPSDHHVEEEASLIAHLRGATRLAAALDHGVVLVGVPAGHDAADYGWIVPESGRIDNGLESVADFCEKPDPDTERQLRRKGALVNSLIVAARGAALLHLIGSALPELVERFWSCPDQSTLSQTVPRLYRELPTHDFSKEVLERCPRDLYVYPISAACGWSDLGTPDRMTRFLQNQHADAA